MNKILLLFMVVFLSSLCCCSPAHRLNLLLKHHPELVKSDTIKKVDTFVTKQHTIDTSFIDRYNTVIDTFTVNNSHETVKYLRTHDTVRIDCNCKKDTIIVKVPEYITTTKPVVIQGLSFWQKLGLILIGLAILLFGLLIGKVLK